MHGPILKLLFPNASQGTFVLQISSITILFSALEQTVNGSLQGIGKIMIPALSLIAGVIVKFILNIILVPIPKIGVCGAAFATVACHAIAFSIGYNVLQKNIEINLKFSKYILKPTIATIFMGFCSYSLYILLKNSIVAEKLATIISILIAIIVYLLVIIILRIFTKDEILMLPMGNKIYNFLVKLKIYE